MGNWGPVVLILILCVGVGGTLGLLSLTGPSSGGIGPEMDPVDPPDGDRQPKQSGVEDGPQPAGDDGDSGLTTERTTGIDDEIPPTYWNESVLGYRTDDPPFRFREVSADVGLSYTYVDSYTGAQEMISNAGVYASDFDRDGWTDVLLVGGPQPVLFENDAGSFEATDEIPALNRSVQSALFVDVDADGWEDLLLFANHGRPVVLANDEGSFERRETDLPRLTMPMSATAADFTGNGCPDLFVAQNGDWQETRPASETDRSVTPAEDNGNPNRFFEGDCESFTERTEQAGITGTAWSLSTAGADFDGDGAVDVYVANDFNRDVLYRNDGTGTFERERQPQTTNRNGMSAAVADVTGSGSPDVFVTNIYAPEAVADEYRDLNVRAAGNTLRVNDGTGTFVDRAPEFGVQKGGFGWATAFADFDNDGDQDLFHTSRMFSEQEISLRMRDHDAVFPFYRYPVVRERRADGFVPRHAETVGFSELDGRGVARLDYDRDGRPDLLVADANGEYRLYENEAEAARSIQVRVRDDGAPAFGSTVTVTADGATQTRFHTARSDFLSQSSRLHHVGVGDATRADVTVTWPDGTTREFTDVRTGQRVTVTPSGIGDRTQLDGPP